MIVEPASGQILAEVEVGRQPHHAVLSPDEGRVYVSNRGTDDVSVVDAQTYDVVSTIAVGDEPHEMAVRPAGDVLYVTNAGSYDVSVIDLEQGREVKRLAAAKPSVVLAFLDRMQTRKGAALSAISAPHRCPR